MLHPVAVVRLPHDSCLIFLARVHPPDSDDLELGTEDVAEVLPSLLENNLANLSSPPLILKLEGLILLVGLEGDPLRQFCFIGALVFQVRYHMEVKEIAEALRHD